MKIETLNRFGLPIGRRWPNPRRDNATPLQIHLRTARHLMGRASAYLNCGNVEEARAMVSAAASFIDRANGAEIVPFPDVLRRQ